MNTDQLQQILGMIIPSHRLPPDTRFYVTVANDRDAYRVVCYRGKTPPVPYGVAYLDVPFVGHCIDDRQMVEELQRVAFEALRRSGWVAPHDDRGFRIARRGPKRLQFAAQRTRVECP